jgi:hypothetical protein
MSWKKTNQKCPYRNPSKIIIYKMFEEIVESQLIIQFKIREGKIETQLSLMA